MSNPPPSNRGHQLVAWGFVAVQVLLIAGVILVPRGSQWPLSPALQWVGWIAMIAGIGIGLWAARYLGRGLTASPLPNGAVTLVTAGPYRYMRHPMYTAVMLIVSGVALRSGSWMVVALTVGLGALFWVKSAWEEQRLAETFPGYPAYQQAVPRFIPLPRRAAA
jgi:protein-S-isoprenylcysteine O-methyltransferase Ste14